jgi:DnaJ-class molecular chaperone
MATKENCSKCDGSGVMTVLTSPHDDKKEEVKCTNCNGRGLIHRMSDEDEADYHADYW